MSKLKKLICCLMAVALLCMQVMALAEGTGAAAAGAKKSVASKTTSDIVSIKKVAAQGTEKIQDDFIFEMAKGEESAPVEQEIKNLFNFVNRPQTDAAEAKDENGEPIPAPAPMEYFDEDLRKQVEEKFIEMCNLGIDPEAEKEITEYDVSNIEINEIVALRVKNYKEAYGAIEVEFAFPTMYEIGQKVMVMVGTYSGELVENEAAKKRYAVEWHLVEAEVVEDDAMLQNLNTADKSAEAAGADSALNSVVRVTFPPETVKAMGEAASISMLVLSEPMPEPNALS